ncbi:cell division topological specificity factor MinE [Jeongeupia naejangsanensis]|uniref:Cell division topological specificity factor n=1 Tax=Jeongeupia naejangsanensis TaxID=613195 RepID=A0ABS2BLL9_9NEIS|nr:cell division topological specificity factor MinE [Jeongeupia naejangsanensis]MBM3115669.1 cell division topological specificity factor MinE [Jeongeupia naejangsanensis]
MSILSYFFGEKKKTASVARERLQIILAHERAEGRGAPDYLPQLQKELMEVISKYVSVSPDDIKVQLDKRDDMEVLEVNIVLPEAPRR